MAEIKDTGLPAGSAPTGSDIYTGVQSGSSVRWTHNQLKEFANPTTNTFSLDTGATHFFGNVMGFKSSDDQIRVSIYWGNPDSTATTLTITEPPTGSITFSSATNSQTSALGSYTITNLSIEGPMVFFIINQTGIAASITTLYPIWMKVAGQGGVFTLS